MSTGNAERRQICSTAATQAQLVEHRRAQRVDQSAKIGQALGEIDPHVIQQRVDLRDIPGQ
jgi:hypothetical protein